jgi:HEAT repeats
MSDAFDPNAPTHELIAFALSQPSNDDGADPRWDAVVALHKRGTREVFDATAPLFRSACPVERALAADVHAQLGFDRDHPFAPESARLVCEMLETETDIDVLDSGLIALGFLRRPETVPALLRFAVHPHSRVRYAVAHSLAGHDTEPAVCALVTLSADEDTKVRDWATFALGSQTELDTPALRAALRARLNDPDPVTRGEALKGLANRRDKRAADAIRAELARPDVDECAVEAAETLGDPRLVPALEGARRRWPGSAWLEGVIDACRTSERAE